MLGSNKTFAEILGNLVGKIIIVCLAAIITSVVIAISIKIVQGILFWVF